MTMRQRDGSGGLRDRVGGSGANRGLGNSSIQDRLDELIDQARLNAVSEARRRAEMYVKAAGGTLGALVTINEGQAYHPPMYRLEHTPAMAHADLPIAGGTPDLSTTVTVTYTINNNFVCRP